MVLWEITNRWKASKWSKTFSLPRKNSKQSTKPVVEQENGGEERVERETKAKEGCHLQSGHHRPMYCDRCGRLGLPLGELGVEKIGLTSFRHGRSSWFRLVQETRSKDTSSGRG